MQADLLVSMLQQLNQKENPPQTDDNTLLTKNIIPNDSATMADGGCTFSQIGPPSSFYWGSFAYSNPGWWYGAGQWG